MKMYLEFIFIINFLLDFMILYGTKRILKLNKPNYRLLIGSIFGSFTTFLVFYDLNNIFLILIKSVLSLIIVFISFGLKTIFTNLLYFYLISIILGGTLYLFDLNNNYYFNFLLLILASPFIIFIIVKEFLAYKENYSNKYAVEIYIKKKKYSLEGFIDTGNRLVSPLKKEPVILVNLNLNPRNVIYVPYKALNTSGIIPCIRPDRVTINNKEFNNCLIGLSKDKFSISGVNCILPNKFKEEL